MPVRTDHFVSILMLMLILILSCLGMSVYEQIASRTRARRHRKDQKLNEQVEGVGEDEEDDDDEDDDRSSVVLQVSAKRMKNSQRQIELY